jgi:cell division protein FtsL
MKKKTTKRIKKIGRIERAFYSLVVFVVISFPFAVVFLQATLSRINVQVEQVKKEIRTQEKKNQSLSMKINELASLDKIIEVAHEQGLSYNNNNIKSVD